MERAQCEKKKKGIRRKRFSWQKSMPKAALVFFLCAAFPHMKHFGVFVQKKEVFPVNGINKANHSHYLFTPTPPLSLSLSYSHYNPSRVRLFFLFLSSIIKLAFSSQLLPWACLQVFCVASLTHFSISSEKQKQEGTLRIFEMKNCPANASSIFLPLPAPILTRLERKHRKLVWLSWCVTRLRLFFIIKMLFRFMLMFRGGWLWRWQKSSKPGFERFSNVKRIVTQKSSQTTKHNISFIIAW